MYTYIYLVVYLKLLKYVQISLDVIWELHNGGRSIYGMDNMDYMTFCFLISHAFKVVHAFINLHAMGDIYHIGVVGIL